MIYEYVEEPRSGDQICDISNHGPHSPDEAAILSTLATIES
jgi:hypothetical protein